MAFRLGSIRTVSQKPEEPPKPPVPHHCSRGGEGRAGPAPWWLRHWDCQSGECQRAHPAGKAGWLTSSAISQTQIQGFESTYTNISTICELLGGVKGPVLQIQSRTLQGQRADTKRHEMGGARVHDVSKTHKESIPRLVKGQERIPKARKYSKGICRSQVYTQRLIFFRKTY